LHERGLLILPNAWDAASARLIESLGAKAIATTSAGVAWSHGYADGNVLPVPLLAATVAEIARVVSVPVSADVDAGYSDDPAGAGEAGWWGRGPPPTRRRPGTPWGQSSTPAPSESTSRTAPATRISSARRSS